MGIYLYTFRAKTTNMTLTTGEVVGVHHLCYAYKLGSYTQASSRIEANYLRAAVDAFRARTSSYVIVCDVKRGPTEGDPVYADMPSATWTDCDDLKATPVGFCHKVGRKWHVVKETPWRAAHNRTAWDEDTNTFRPVACRDVIVMVDGKKRVWSEQKFVDHKAQAPVTMEQASSMTQLSG